MDEVAAEAALGGVNLVQLREKDLPTRALLDLAGRLKAVLDPLGVPLVVNGRVDVAFAADAAGVHLPSDGLPVSGARAALGDARLIARIYKLNPELKQEAALQAGQKILVERQ